MATARGGFPRRGDRPRGTLCRPVRSAGGCTSRTVVVFAGRHIPEKRVTALVPAIARARERIPELRGEIYGDGPDRAKVLRAIEQHGLNGAVDAPGFVEAERVTKALVGRCALCCRRAARDTGSSWSRLRPSVLRARRPGSGQRSD